VERRLAAVVGADVAGYGRLMGADKEGTLARLRAFRRTLVDPSIAAHRGRIVKSTGDCYSARNIDPLSRGIGVQNWL
jgi:adenylate cyclase